MHTHTHTRVSKYCIHVYTWSTQQVAQHMCFFFMTSYKNAESNIEKSWRQDPWKQQLYGHLPPITKTIKIRRTRHAGHCWRNRDDFISDVLLWTPLNGRAKARRPARTYIQQLCADTGWTIGRSGERGSRMSVLMARLDDDDDDDFIS